MTANGWIEIISVRLNSPKHRAAVHEIFNQIKAVPAGVTENPVQVELYLNAKNETDWSIYIHRQQQLREPVKSILGANIAEALSSFGLINHTFWKKV